MQRIAVDQDQVLADLLSEWVARYNYDYNDNLTPEDVTDWNWDSIVKESCGSKIYTYLDDPELFENLPVIRGSQDTLENLSKRYELFVVTAPWNAENVIPKTRWLNKHFDFIPEKNYVFTRNKSIINASWLIDDKPQNLESFDGYPLLFTAPHNLKESRFHRVDSWEAVEKFFDVI